MKCDELKQVEYPIEWGLYYDKAEVDEAIAELKDKIQMHDFFWEGCGFAKRGFKNAIAVSEAFDRLEAENAELKKKLMPCLNGDCILTCEVVEKYGKENAELKQMLEDAKASHYAEMVDAGMRERKLKRALWVTRTSMAKSEKDRWNSHVDCGNKRNRKDPAFVKTGKLLEVSEWRKLWADNETKCRAKAEEYK